MRAVLVLLALVAIDIAILAFPSPLFAHKHNYDEFTIYSRRPIPDDLELTVAEVRTRIAVMEHARPGASCQVFICDSERLYSIFSFLTRRSANSMAIGMSWLGHVYVNETKIQRVAAHNYRGIRHSRFEGNLAEVIAHEIVHFNMVKTLGFRQAINLPVWKSEGYAEYQANLAATRADSSYDFTQRIDLLLDHTAWDDNSSLAGRLFQWHLLVEFLAEVKGVTLEDLAADAVNEESAREEMLAWYGN